WGESFSYERWQKAFAESGIDPEFYAHRERSYDEVLPWAQIDSGISTEFLKSENEKSKQGITTKDCRKGCAGCGINRYTNCPMGGVLVNE
ncbi:MAG: B12-binding domain-containing radical SAM protein, partial [Firmicutes bacterium]|nr:B12-binding domain-containing radical SAM protein [Bacillota bacterium]